MRKLKKRVLAEHPVGSLGRNRSETLARDDAAVADTNRTPFAGIHHVDPDRIGRRYRSTKLVSWPLRRLWLDVVTEGLANVPAHGPVILAANHLSFLDSLLLMYETPRPVCFLGKAEYLDSPLTRRLFPAAGMIPVERSGRGVGWSLRLAQERLARDEVIGIFPEGTRSRDSLLHRGHCGVAHLALRSGAPIVPVGIIGTDKAQPPDSRMPRRAVPIKLCFGPPVDLGRWQGARPLAGVKHDITDEVMRSIAALSGQVYDRKVSDVDLRVTS